MLKIHPKVFSMIDCWVSDSESPVVPEINLDAVERNGNEFYQDGMYCAHSIHRTCYPAISLLPLGSDVIKVSWFVHLSFYVRA